MKLDDITGVEALSDFLSGSQAIFFEVASKKQERYKLIAAVLKKTRYLGLSRKEKSIVKAFLIKATGYSRAQITRLFSSYAEKYKRAFKPSKINGFQKKYTMQDIALLAKMDRRYDCLSGGAPKSCVSAHFIILMIWNNYLFKNFFQFAFSFSLH